MPDPRPLGSSYLLNELIGRGAMGQVWRGSVVSDGTPVAIKILRSELSEDPEIVARFHREGSIMLAVSHPCVVAVRDVISEGDTLAIVMDLIEGGDLRAYLGQAKNLRASEALRLIGQVLAGLQAVHSAGILHRDLKPENILIDSTGSKGPVARLTDFGIARFAEGPTITRLTGLIGTPQYLAPEVIAHGRATTTSDLYSAGIVLYELLSGRVPFSAAHPAAVLRQHIEDKPLRPEGLEDDLWGFVAHLLEKEPADRLSSAAQAARECAVLAYKYSGRAALVPAAERLEDELPTFTPEPAEEPPRSRNDGVPPMSVILDDLVGSSFLKVGDEDAGPPLAEPGRHLHPAGSTKESAPGGPKSTNRFKHRAAARWGVVLLSIALVAIAVVGVTTLRTERLQDTFRQGIALGNGVIVRSGPSVNSERTGSVAAGDSVDIVCRTRGDMVVGVAGPTDLWNKIREPVGFVSDGFLDTGGQTINAPECSADDVPNITPASIPGGGSSTVAVETSLNSPSSIAIGPDGNLYIAEGENSRVLRLQDGHLVRVAGSGHYGFGGDGGPALEATMSRPAGIAFGPDGSLYIADEHNRRIRRVGPDGIIRTVAGSGPEGNEEIGRFSGDGGPATEAGLKQVSDVAVSPDGSIYIADPFNQRIRRVDSAGNISNFAGSGLSGGPGAFSGDGGPANQARLSGPDKVEVGPDGSVLFSETGNNRVRRVDRQGIITTIAGSGLPESSAGFSGDGGPATKAKLSAPKGLEVGRDGSIYVAVSFSNRVRKIAPDGTITTVAGSGPIGDSAGFSGDGGPATEASLNGPADVAVDGAGNLYVTDCVNGRIRMVDSRGIISTIAGIGTISAGMC